MRLKMIAVAVSIFCLMAGMALAADITGTWVAEMSGGPGGGGPGGGGMQITFNFKASGNTFTGTTEAMGNSSPISEGKIDGDKISFVVKVDMGGNAMTINYKGTVAGDEMKLTFSMEGGMGGPGGGEMPPMELVAKRKK